MSYNEAKAKYAALGVDTDAAIAKLKTNRPLTETDVFTVLTVWCGIMSVIDTINVNAVV